MEDDSPRSFDVSNTTTQMRRLSILKSQKKSVDAETVADIQTGPRRVSFANSNLIKPFATDTENVTIWDNTYEEEVQHTGSSVCTDTNKSEVRDTIICVDEDMELTLEDTLTNDMLSGVLKSCSINQKTMIFEDTSANMELTFPFLNNIIQKGDIESMKENINFQELSACRKPPDVSKIYPNMELTCEIQATSQQVAIEQCVSEVIDDYKEQIFREITDETKMAVDKESQEANNSFLSVEELHSQFDIEWRNVPQETTMESKLDNFLILEDIQTECIGNVSEFSEAPLNFSYSKCGNLQQLVEAVFGGTQNQNKAHFKSMLHGTRSKLLEIPKFDITAIKNRFNNSIEKYTRVLCDKFPKIEPLNFEQVNDVLEKMGSSKLGGLETSYSTEPSTELTDSSDLSLCDQIVNSCSRYEKYLKLKHIEAGMLALAVFDGAIYIFAKIHQESGDVLSVKTKSCLDEHALEVGQFIVKEFFRRFSESNLVSCLGAVYNIFSLLDYIQVSLVEIFKLEPVASDKWAADLSL